MAATITVTTTSDTTSVDGAVSLREAISSIDAGTSVNTDVSSTVSGSYGSNDTIAFNIPGGGVQTINVAAGGLPALTAAMTIDGYTQPGATPNTNALSDGSNAVLRIELNGASGATDGIVVQGPNVTVRGLVINRFVDAISVSGAGASGAKIEGNYVGTNASGDAARANYVGVAIHDAPNVTVGGTSASARNLLSGNWDAGNGTAIRVTGAGAPGVRIQGNLIGTNAAGTNSLPNGQGIAIQDAPAVQVGGTTTGAGNLVSGNHMSAISVLGVSAGGAFI